MYKIVNMLNLRSIFITALLFLILTLGQTVIAQRRIVVYVQNASSTATVQWTKMTHLVHAFLNPMSNTSGDICTGGVANGATIWFTTPNFTAMRTAALAANPNLKIIISAGGAPTASDPNITNNFNALLALPAQRAALVQDYGDFIQNYNLDGFDFDLEHPDDVTERANHQLFLQAMRVRLDALEITMCKQLEISIALNGETDHFILNPCGSDFVNGGVDAFVDFYHLMTYDATYSNHNAVNPLWPLNHAPLIHAQESVRDFSSAPFNWSKTKMCVGIPFYGKTGANGLGGTQIYSAMGNTAAILNDADDTNPGGYNYNACPTITNKVNFVNSDNLAGIVIWEGSQDVAGANSLLNCAYNAFGGAANKLVETGCCAQPALGNDKVVCETAFPITLNSSTATTGTAVTYTWTRILPSALAIGSGATANTQVITAGNGAGTYVVVRTETVAGRTCTRSDTIAIAATLPVPNLGSDQTLCDANYNITPSNLSAFPAGTTWQWQFGGSNIAGATTTSFYASTPGTYTLIATLAGCTNTSDDIIITASTVLPVDACRTTAGTLALSVTGGTGPYNWYGQDSPGGTILAGGSNTSSYTTPVLPLPSVTDYFVEDVGSASNYVIGVTTASASLIDAFFANPLNYANGNITMEFDVTAPIKIRSVALWGYTPSFPATFYIVIYNDNNQPVYTGPNIAWTAVQAGQWQTITIDASLPIGKYRIQAVPVVGAPAFFHHKTGFTPPYTGGAGKISITREFGTSPLQFGPFFNWQISDFGTCKRVRVRATVNASCSATLPVDLVSFTAKKIDKDALLEWSTTREVNSGFYRVERSLNGTDFNPIGQVTSAGNTNSLSEYSYLDVNIPSGLVYYRLLQYDVEGTHAYSKIVVVENAKAVELVIAPNPFSEHTTIYVKGTSKAVLVKVYNLEGQLMSNTNYTNASQAITVGQGLESGMYILQVSNSDFTATHKLIKE